MTGELSDHEQTMLRNSVRALLTGRGERTWAELIGGVGLGAALLDPRQGAIVAEEIGRARAALPFAAAATGRWLLAQHGVSALSDTAIAVLAWAEPGLRYDLADIEAAARPEGDGWRIEGTKSIVGWSPACDALLVAVRTSGAAGERSGLSLFRVDPTATDGLRRHAYRTIDGHPAADLMFDDCRLTADARIGPAGRAIDLIEEARDRAMALLAAEAVGLLDSLLEQTLSYTGQRRQFGQPIGEFQALQHRMVDMYLECELARSSAWLAVEALGEEAAVRQRAVSSAMVNISRACRFVGQQAIQLHGGMGMTDELPVGHYVKRAMAIEVEWADTDWHLARIAGL